MASKKGLSLIKKVLKPPRKEKGIDNTVKDKEVKETNTNCDEISPKQ